MKSLGEFLSSYQPSIYESRDLLFSCCFVETRSTSFYTIVSFVSYSKDPSGPKWVSIVLGN